jgi:DnaJ-class molecular chaperone
MPDDKQVCIECDGCGTMADDSICKLCKGIGLVKSGQPLSLEDIWAEYIEKRNSGGVK